MVSHLNCPENRQNLLWSTRRQRIRILKQQQTRDPRYKKSTNKEKTLHGLQNYHVGIYVVSVQQQAADGGNEDMNRESSTVFGRSCTVCRCLLALVARSKVRQDLNRSPALQKSFKTTIHVYVHRHTILIYVGEITPVTCTLTQVSKLRRLQTHLRHGHRVQN